MIYIVRHGQTEKNKAKVLQGRSDVPLNDAGRQQAAEVRERFEREGISFDKIYTSPLVRAVETAQIVAGAAPHQIVAGAAPHQIVTGAAPQQFEVDSRLIEMDYGPYEGMDLTHPAPEIITFFSDFVHNPAPEGMEPLPEVVARLGTFLEEIRDEARGRTILLSTHAIAMKGALEYLTPESKGSYWSKYIGNCAVYKVEVGPDGSFGIPAEW